MRSYEKGGRHSAVRSMTVVEKNALSNCNIVPIVVDIGPEKLERVFRLGANRHVTMLSRPHEGALPCKKPAPLPSPRRNGYRRNSAGDLGNLLLIQRCKCSVFGVTAYGLKQAGQDQVFGKRDVLLLPWVRAVVPPKDGRITAVRQRGPEVTALVLAVEVEMIALDGELPVLVHWLVEDVLSSHDFSPLSCPAIPPLQRHRQGHPCQFGIAHAVFRLDRTVPKFDQLLKNA